MLVHQLKSQPPVSPQLLLSFSYTLLLVNVDDILMKGEGLISVTKHLLIHHSQYFSHSAESLVRAHDKIIRWLNVLAHELLCVLQERLGVQSKAAGSNNRGKGRSGQSVEGGDDGNKDGEEEVDAEAFDNGMGFIDWFAIWSFVVGSLKNGLFSI